MFERQIMDDSNHGHQVVDMTFVRLCCRWFADVPDWNGSINSLEMIAGSDELLNHLNKNGHFV